MSDRKLLDVARDAPCMLRLTRTCGRYPTVCVHSDMLRHGRGVGHKSRAIFAVPGCPDCHAAFTRAALGREGYEETWRRAHEEYLPWLIENERLKVA